MQQSFRVVAFEFTNCFSLYLSDAFPTNSEFVADVCQRVLRAVHQAISKDNYLRLSGVEFPVEDFGDNLYFSVVKQVVFRRNLGLIRDQFGKGPVRESSLIGASSGTGSLVALKISKTFFSVSSTALAISRVVGSRPSSVVRSDCACLMARRPATIAGYPNHLSLLVECAFDGLHDPPSRVSAEPEAEGVVELIHRSHQSKTPFLHQIEEG